MQAFAMAMRRARIRLLVVTIVGAILVIVGLGRPMGRPFLLTAGTLSNTAPSGLHACNAKILDNSAACLTGAVSDFSRARAAEGLGPMKLPSNFTSLDGAQQLMVLANIDRVDRGLAPISGISSTLNAYALTGANTANNPAFPPYARQGGSNWASTISPLWSEFLWMYDDGWNGSATTNVDCSSATAAGCWGHRQVILNNYGTPIAMGAATGSAGDAELILGPDTTDAVDGLTWASVIPNLAAAPPATTPLGSHVAPGWNPSYGSPIGPEMQGTFGGVTGYYQTFANGLGLIASPFGVFPSNGAIYSSWKASQSGWPTGAMYRISGLGVSGYQQSFSGARAFWNPTDPTTRWVNGSILAMYDQSGGTSALGWPTAPMSAAVANGVQGWVQNLQNGMALIASQFGVYASNGAIYGSWVPSMGWPTGAMYAASGQGLSGYQQNFMGGTAMRAFWNFADPTTRWINGSILASYDQRGGTGALGWPTAPMWSRVAGGVQGWVQNLQNGWALIASTYGVFSSNGVIFAAWNPDVNGWPTADMTSVNSGGATQYVQSFTQQAINWIG